MIAVLFEVVPSDGCEAAYLDIAASLRPLLEEIDGFISIERFRSIQDPSRILSLSFFEDEAAVARWRTLETHRRAQTAGRESLFTNYRLRIAQVTRDYGLTDRREQAPSDSAEYHDARARDAR